MWHWVNDHVEAIVTGIITAIVSIVVGFIGAARMFLGLQSEMETIKGEQQVHRAEIAEIKQDAAAAHAERQAIKDNTDLLIKHLIEKE